MGRLEPEGSGSYDAKVMPVQWNSFTKEKGITGGTIDFFAKQNGFRGFDVEAADSPQIVDNWVFVVGLKRFVELGSLFEVDREQFDANVARSFLRGRASEHVLKTSRFRTLRAATYWPERERITVEDGVEKLNFWRPSGMSPHRVLWNRSFITSGIYFPIHVRPTSSLTI